MASSATVTAKSGAGNQATTLVIADISSFSFNCDGNVCAITLRNGTVQYYAGYSTITVTVSGSNYILTLS